MNNDGNDEIELTYQNFTTSADPSNNTLAMSFGEDDPISRDIVTEESDEKKNENFPKNEKSLDTDTNKINSETES